MDWDTAWTELQARRDAVQPAGEYSFGDYAGFFIGNVVFGGRLFLAYLVIAILIGGLKQRAARFILSVALSMIASYASIVDAGFREIGGPRYLLCVVIYLALVVGISEVVAVLRARLSKLPMQAVWKRLRPKADR